MTDYANIPGLNWSRLKVMMTSPKHYQHQMKFGRPDSPALLRGRVAHCALYEPELMSARYVISPNFHGGMKDENAIIKGYDGGKAAKAAWTLKMAKQGAEVVEDKMYSLAVAMAKAVREDDVAGPLLKGTYVEQTLTWADEVTGRSMKCRIDQVNGRLGDMKTSARGISPRQFGSQVESMGYLGQLALYSDGLRMNGIDVDDLPVMLVVEADPPHDVVVYEVSEDELDAGRMLYRRLMAELAACEAKDNWPGIGKGEMQKLIRPAWAIADEERHELTMGGMPLEV